MDSEKNDSTEEAVLQLRVRKLETGMILARDVYSKDGCTLLQEGKTLTTKDIDRLHKWNQRYVYIVPPEDDSQNSQFAQAS